MSDSKSDLGVITVLAKRMETQRLPRALHLKEKVDRGELLDDLDIAFLEEVFADSNNMRTLIARHPEFQDLAARIMHLYKEITDRALANEKASH